jgi:hypothetical protein
MKRLLVLGMGVLSMALLFTSMQAGCAPKKGTPISPPTPQPTATSTPGIGTATFPVLYSDGAFAAEPGLVVDAYCGGNVAACYPTFNPTDTTLNGYNGDWYGFLDQWTSTEVSGMAGWSGIVVTGGAVNFSTYTTCTFWAKANESASVGFNAAEPTGDTLNVPEALTTTWTQYTLNIANGTRTDGYAGAVTAVANYFVVVITAAPATTPLNTSFDQVQFQ